MFSTLCDEEILKKQFSHWFCNTRELWINILAIGQQSKTMGPVPVVAILLAFFPRGLIITLTASIEEIVSNIGDLFFPRWSSTTKVSYILTSGKKKTI